MTFNQKQIDEILRIIDFQHAFFIGRDLDSDLLTEDDKHLLRSYGVKPEQIRQEYTPFEQSFYFGRLSSALGDLNAAGLDYNDFLKYLRRGQYIPLNDKEKNALEYVKRQSYSHIKNLGQTIKKEAEQITIYEDAKKRHDYEKTIQGSLERAIIQRDSVKNIVLEIGNKTKDWGRNLGRIAETEMQNAFEAGRAEEIRQKGGNDALVYKDVFAGACRHCIRLYLTNGIGSQPIIFKLSKLVANGSNVGRKANDWKAVVGAMHPYCRCLINNVKSGYIWDVNKKRFVLGSYERKVERTSKARVQVGDKVFYV